MTMDYVFEKMSNGAYQVRLCGEFICFSMDTDEKQIDEVLKYYGYESREDFLKNC